MLECGASLLWCAVCASVPLVPLDTKRGGRGRGSRSRNGVDPRRRSGRAAIGAVALTRVLI
eukprot:scaffold19235_cov126-Isochrysis_galbana.AAC.17